MRAWHALERALLQCTEGLRSDCSLRLTVQCVPQVKMGRSCGVCMTKLGIRKDNLHNEVHLSYPQLALAAAMPLPPLRPTIGPAFTSGVTSSPQIHGSVSCAGLINLREAVLAP